MQTLHQAVSLKFCRNETTVGLSSNNLQHCISAISLYELQHVTRYIASMQKKTLYVPTLYRLRHTDFMLYVLDYLYYWHHATTAPL